MIDRKFDTQAPIPDWQLEPDEEAWGMNYMDSEPLVDADGNPLPNQPTDPLAPQPGTEQVDQQWLDEVLRRNPEVKWRRSADDLRRLQQKQRTILDAAASMVRPGGRLVYATCSPEPEENEGVVKSVCRGMRGVALEAENHSTPGRPSDGGYWARLRKAK